MNSSKKTPAQILLDREEKRLKKLRGKIKSRKEKRKPPKDSIVPQPKESPLVLRLLSQLEMCEHIPTPILEHKFHSSRKWRLDIAWPSRFVAVEVHGGIYSHGRHTRGKGFENDREKMNEALLANWKVLEVTSDQIQSGQALDWIERALSPVAGV